jgi:hypothetical protein
MEIIPEEVEHFLNLPSSVLMGSRGLGVESKESDYDIAIYVYELDNKDLIHFQRLEVRNYFNVVPSVGDLHFYRKKGIDLLVFSSRLDTNVVKYVMADLRMVPKYLLKDKPTRIQLYQKALVHYGFKRAVQNDNDDDF